ncbi:hypothetical protein M8J76_017170 [Diaphorina citri]|nr:hypothetical protein M8J76_017170 [Diaphorina citri]
MIYYDLGIYCKRRVVRKTFEKKAQPKNLQTFVGGLYIFDSELTSGCGECSEQCWYSVWYPSSTLTMLRTGRKTLTKF